VPLRKGLPLTWRPKGLSDAIDGTNAFDGAMASLSNLIPDPSTESVWQPRPPALLAADFPSFSSPGFISAEYVIGNRVYGMIASAANSGKDEPFVFDLSIGGFITLTGVTNANTPTSPPTSGDWTPPRLKQVAGRVIVTHPGFPGDTVKFGWFDISGFDVATVGDTVSGSPVITGKPNILGTQPGMAIIGTGIPANTTVLAASNSFTAVSVTGTTHGTAVMDGIASTAAVRVGANVSGPGILPGTTVAAVTSSVALLLSQVTTSSVTGTFVIALASPSQPGYISGTLTSGSAVIAIADTTGLWVGQSVSGQGIPDGSTVLSLVANTSVTISATVTATGPFPLSFDGTIIIMSANATASANGVALSIVGGSVSAPLWGAGDTQLNPLPSVPVDVGQMNGRAWFACGINGIPFSDPGFPCQISNNTAVQALTTNDGLAVTAIGELQLTSALGGIVQSLIAFEGTVKMQQITGDPVFNNLSMNSLPVTTGTLAPNTICSTEMGLAFVSPEGLRVIGFTGAVSPPIGDHGQGITAPFIYAVNPSRMCAAANSDTIRITVTDGWKPGAPNEEYWFDFGRRIWHGPHTSTCSLIEAWGPRFVMALIGVDAKLFVANAVPTSTDGYVENGVTLSWQFEPVYMLPDTGDMTMNSLVEMTLACGGPDCSAIAPAEPLLYPPQGPPTVITTPNQPPPPPPPPPPLPCTWTIFELARTFIFEGVVYTERDAAATWVSDNGLVIFGYIDESAVYWTPDNVAHNFVGQIEKYQLAGGGAGDGTLFVGTTSDSGPVLWVYPGGVDEIIAGSLTGVQGISDDGLTVFGQHFNGLVNQAAYSRNGETAILDPLTGAGASPPGSANAASGDSLDAMVIVGNTANPSGIQHAVVWTLIPPGIIDLGRGIAYAVTADGTIVAGVSTSDALVNSAFIWNVTDGLVLLPRFPDTDTKNYVARGVSDQLSAAGDVRVVGEGPTPDGNNTCAIYWEKDSDGAWQIHQLPGPTPVYGPEMIYNGGFVGSASGWILGSGFTYGDYNVVFTWNTDMSDTLAQNMRIPAPQQVDPHTGIKHESYELLVTVGSLALDGNRVAMGSSIFSDQASANGVFSSVELYQTFSGFDSLVFEDVNSVTGDTWTVTGVSIRTIAGSDDRLNYGAYNISADGETIVGYATLYNYNGTEPVKWLCL
jgi:hypothetical protein